MTKKRLLLIVPVALLAIFVALVAWWFLFRSTPEEANLADLAESIEVPSGDSGDIETPTDLTGEWSLTTGESVFVGYRIDEVLNGVGDFTVVGRTSAIEGSLTASGLTIERVEITADVTQLKSDRSSRDSQLKRQALESNTFPTAVFVLTEPIVIGSIPGPGESLVVGAVGELTAHGVTLPVVMELETGLVGSDILVAGQIEIRLSDYGITSPSAPAVVSVADEAVVEFSLVFALD